MNVPYGVSPSTEAFVRMPSGVVMAFESAEVSPNGTSYVRFLDKNGGEIAYWVYTEWEESPEEVMGAICGAMMEYKELDKNDRENFYQFFPDCQFAEGINYVPHGE